jgi:hypothetical protein
MQHQTRSRISKSHWLESLFEDAMLSSATERTAKRVSSRKTVAKLRRMSYSGLVGTAP